MGRLFGTQEADVEFVKTVTGSHECKDTWFYKLFWTEKFIDVMKTKNNLSIYELLGTNGFQTEQFSILLYLFIMNSISSDQSIYKYIALGTL